MPGPFREQGSNGSPVWRIEYEKYKRLLWDRDAPWVEHLLHDLTTKIFGSDKSISRQPRIVNQADDSGDYERLLAATRASRQAARGRSSAAGDVLQISFFPTSHFQFQILRTLIQSVAMAIWITKTGRIRWIECMLALSPCHVERAIVLSLMLKVRSFCGYS